MTIHNVAYWLIASGLIVIGVKSDAVKQPVNQCLTKQESTVKFSVTNHQNATGHWLYKVTMESEKKAGYRPWLVEVEQNTVACGGVEFLRSTTMITAPAPKAGPGYEYHPGVGYYKLHTEVKKWPEAKEICEAEGGHLAIVNSEAESATLVGIFARYAYLTGWISVGFHDQYQEAQYVTIFDEPIAATGFTRWAPNQPDNSKNAENSGSIYKTSGGLNDINCASEINFICEQELP